MNILQCFVTAVLITYGSFIPVLLRGLSYVSWRLMFGIHHHYECSKFILAWKVGWYLLWTCSWCLFGGLQLSTAHRGLDLSGLLQVSNSDVKDSAVCVCVLSVQFARIFPHTSHDRQGQTIHYSCSTYIQIPNCGFQPSAAVYALLEFYAAQIGSSSPTFQDLQVVLKFR